MSLYRSGTASHQLQYLRLWFKCVPSLWSSVEVVHKVSEGGDPQGAVNDRLGRLDQTLNGKKGTPLPVRPPTPMMMPLVSCVSSLLSPQVWVFPKSHKGTSSEVLVDPTGHSEERHLIAAGQRQTMRVFL